MGCALYLPLGSAVALSKAVFPITFSIQIPRTGGYLGLVFIIGGIQEWIGGYLIACGCGD